jgi:two-component system response regulator CpxR
MDRILIIDDDIQLCKLLAERIAIEGFAIDIAHDGVRGLECALSAETALVVLDWMLPGMSGLDVLRRLRRQSPVPVLILTARGEDDDRVAGLEAGADDYVPKPFNPRELIARIRAILRRTGRVRDSTEVKIAGDLSLNLAAREVLLQGTPLNLTSLEYTLLEVLVSNAGRILSRDELTRAVLGRELGPFDRVIDVHVSNLRKKLGTVHYGQRIKAIRGSGYLFVARPEAGKTENA